MIEKKPEGTTHIHFYNNGGYDIFNITKEQGVHKVLLWNDSVWIDYTYMCDEDELLFLLENCEV